MNPSPTPEELRELFLAASDPSTPRALALASSLSLVVAVLWLVRRRSLREGRQGHRRELRPLGSQLGF